MGHIPRVVRRASIDGVSADLKTDCALKQLAWEYAVALQGQFQPAVKTLVHDALELGTKCGYADPVPVEEQKFHPHFPKQLAWNRHARRTPHHPIHPHPHATRIDLYIAAQGGSDSNPGTVDAPLASLAQAVKLLRFTRPATGPIEALSAWPATITFRAGMYYFASPVELGPRDSFLTLQAYPGEAVTLSGGVDLGQLKWTPFAGEVLMAALPEGMCISNACLNEMYVNGRRAVRARFPNGNPETHGLWTVNSTGYISAAAAWLPPWPPADANININLTTPFRPAPVTNFPFYQLGVGGASAVFDPPTSFWGSDNPPAGDTYAVPSGLVYDPKTFGNKSYADVSTAVVHTFHGMYWGSWSFAVGEIVPSKQSLVFSRGGFQEARGASVGAEWYLENVLEELDTAGEWYADQVNGLLYFWPNQTEVELVRTKPDKEGEEEYFRMISRVASPGALGALVATQSATILSVQGSSPHELVESVAIQGLTFAHTSTTFLRTHEVPSGGDWTVVRVGAVQMEYVRNNSVTECVFTGMGGNALVVSRTALNTSIVANEFVWTGASAILLVGSSSNGIDAASVRSQPLGTLVHANLFHEMGIFVKQSSAVFLALTQASTVDGNICFNLARACININDGFGGGHVLSNNLLFNSVRETDDHGPINTWDRQVYLSRSSDGSIGLQQDQSFVTHNFLINNYHSVWPIDHDDGSQWYTDTENYMVYGGYKSYLGNSLTVLRNYYVLPDGKTYLLGQEGEEGEAEQQQMTSILRARKDNLYRTYGTERERLAERDRLLRAGVPADQLAAAVERHLSFLRLKRGSKGVQQLRDGGGVCVQDAGGFGHVYANNTCATLRVANLYDLWMCNGADLSGSIPSLTANKYFTSDPQAYNASCGGNSYFSLAQFQAQGYELGSTVEPSASLDTMLQWGRELFGLQSAADTDKQGSATRPRREKTAYEALM